MVVILFRILILIAFVLLVYIGIKYIRNPERKLLIAKNSSAFYFDDDLMDNKKNLRIVYKGCLFEGEKYLGTTEDSFEVVDIHITVHDSFELRGFTRDDLYFLESEMLIHYPHAKITWKHPINQLLITEIE